MRAFSVQRAVYLVLFLAPCGATVASAATPAEIEADWQRQDQSRMAQIQQTGTVRFAETDLAWPGVKREDRFRIPKQPAAKLDGLLDEPAWSGAAGIPAANPDGPSLRLMHDGKRFYAGIRMATASEAAYRGDPTAADAAGAVDGVKNGRYAFHSGHEPNPWWQVDLGRRQVIGKIVVYNRLDYEPGLHNADPLLILTSDDGRDWKLRYDNQGRHFGGTSGPPPLAVEFPSAPSPVEARYVRLQIRSSTPVFFHLDEVEVYATTVPGKNLALNRPARQSSLSMWSKGLGAGGALLTLGQAKLCFDASDPSRLVMGGSSLTDDAAGVTRQDGQTTIELALPLDRFPGGFPAELQPAEGPPRKLAAGGNWQLVYPEEPALGFGKNRLVVEVRTEGPLDPPVELSLETVVFTPIRPERNTAADRTLTGGGQVRLEFAVEHEGAAAVIVRARQGRIEFVDGRCFYVEPVRETLARAERLADEFRVAAPGQLSELKQQADHLAASERTQGPKTEARRALYRQARWLARRIAWENPKLGFSELLFVKRFTQETYPDVCLNHMPWCSRPGGDLCGLRWPEPDATAEVRNLIAGQLGPGHVHGLDLSWDADRIVFGYAKSKTSEPPQGWLDRRTNFDLRRTVEPTHIFEIGVDGANLRQLTCGEWSDLDPTYLANGDIAFVSERCGCSLQCNEYDKDETSCNLYVMEPDGTTIRRMSVTKDGDYLPHALDDGSLAYTRWEYQERGWANIQSVWVIRPDGTGADALFKQHFNDPWALEDMRSIPGSTKLAAIATGHHTLAAGPVVVIDAHRGMNNPDGIRIVTPGIDPPEGGMSGRPVPEGGVPGAGGYYMTPWPLSETTFLVSYSFGDPKRPPKGVTSEVDPTGYALYLIDVFGTKELIYRDPSISCFAPIPLRPRPRPPVVAEVTEPSRRDAVCAVADV
ncbi:MAG: discoidin domain-containing protein, partial [Pirellulales bacterium]|nr:discoidin domain-containing protein [Pirellulales bacterium]